MSFAIRVFLGSVPPASAVLGGRPSLVLCARGGIVERELHGIPCRILQPARFGPRRRWLLAERFLIRPDRLVYAAGNHHEFCGSIHGCLSSTVLDVRQTASRPALREGSYFPVGRSGGPPGPSAGRPAASGGGGPRWVTDRPKAPSASAASPNMCPTTALA